MANENALFYLLVDLRHDFGLKDLADIWNVTHCSNCKVGSHCRSHQLDHPDHLDFSLEPDQARLKGVYTISLRPRSQTLNYPDPYTSFTRPLDICLIAARYSPDQIGLRSDITRVEVGMIAYRSGKIFNPTKLDRYMNAFRST